MTAPNNPLCSLLSSDSCDLAFPLTPKPKN
jgi:hypothetical protein